MMEKALKNIRVLDIAHWWAGPTTGMLLADMGAEVIKVERPGVGDEQRIPIIHGPGLKGENLVFLFLNRNKKGITLDLKNPRGRDIFIKLVEMSDIVIENFTPGAMERLGLGYQVLSEVNPRIIMVSISGFGQYGPSRERQAFDPVIQAMSGLMSVTGFPEHPPVRVGTPIVDYLGGLFGYCGAMTALYWREQTGEGQWVDVSLMDATTFTLGDRIVRYAALREPELIARVGNELPFVPAITPYYFAKDGYFSLRASGEASIIKLAEIIGALESISIDVEAGKGLSRHVIDQLTDLSQQLLEQIDAPLREFLKDKTSDEAREILERAGIEYIPVRTLDEVMEEPQFKARDMLVEVEHPRIGKLKIPGVVPKLSKTPGRVETPGPLLGQHNEEIYCGLLGYTKEELAKLEEERVI
ncbi:MAG: CoA transferase [Dehalococcoidia bacterium]|nr:CoA transferase [Dehalococcoidia bacterium]